MNKLHHRQTGTRRCLNIEYNGKKLNVREWSNLLDIPVATINARVRAKDPISDILRPLHTPSILEEKQMKATALRVKKKRHAKNAEAKAERQEFKDKAYKREQAWEIAEILLRQEKELAIVTENDCF